MNTKNILIGLVIIIILGGLAYYLFTQPTTTEETVLTPETKKGVQEIKNIFRTSGIDIEGLTPLDIINLRSTSNDKIDEVIQKIKQFRSTKLNNYTGKDREILDKLTDTYIDLGEYTKTRNNLEEKENKLYTMTYEDDCTPEHIQLLKDQSTLVKETIDKSNTVAKKLDAFNKKYPEEFEELRLFVPAQALDKGDGGTELEQTNNEIIRMCEAGEKPW